MMNDPLTKTTRNEKIVAVLYLIGLMICRSPVYLISDTEAGLVDGALYILFALTLQLFIKMYAYALLIVMLHVDDGIAF